MNEYALIKIQSKVLGLDRELYKYIMELLSESSLNSPEHLKIMIESTERELQIYTYILELIISNQNKN